MDKKHSNAFLSGPVHSVLSFSSMSREARVNQWEFAEDRAEQSKLAKLVTVSQHYTGIASITSYI